MLIEAGGGEARELASVEGDFSASCAPSWSADGRFLVVDSGDGHIAIVDVGAGVIVPVARGAEPAWQP
jgi:Tol biopolymer transport system component